MVYKLVVAARRARTRRSSRVAAGETAAMMGDWNIAPQDEDVWSMEYYLDKSHVSPGRAGGVPGASSTPASSTSSARTPRPRHVHLLGLHPARFQKRRGMRIDFILGTPPFAARVAGAAIDREERKGKGASDHAPVVVQLDA